MTNTLEITTNNQPRPLLGWDDLTSKEQKEFDWIEDPIETGFDFFRYKGSTYSLQEFLVAPYPDFEGWDGYHSDSYFSGILIRIVEDGDAVVVATYYS